jgi:hypothetical protein
MAMRCLRIENFDGRSWLVRRYYNYENNDEMKSSFDEELLAGLALN